MPPLTPRLLLQACLFFLTASAFAQELVERETIGPVNHQPTQGLIQTDTGARSEYDLGNGTLRLGENTTINYSEKSGVALQEGTLVFSNWKKNVKSRLGDNPIIIKGDCGFIQAKAGGFVAGSFGSKVVVTWKDKDFAIRGGEILSLTLADAPASGTFDAARQGKTSTLLNGFKRPFPQQKAIDRLVAQQRRLEKRGFLARFEINDAVETGVSTLGKDISSFGDAYANAPAIKSETPGNLVDSINVAKTVNIDRSGLALVVADFGFQSRVGNLASQESTVDKPGNGGGHGYGWFKNGGGNGNPPLAPPGQTKKGHEASSEIHNATRDVHGLPPLPTRSGGPPAPPHLGRP